MGFQVIWVTLPRMTRLSRIEILPYGHCPKGRVLLRTPDGRTMAEFDIDVILSFLDGGPWWRLERK
jgi:hypothetical protein